MSATIPENMLLSDLLKSTGYDCPDSLKDKTFDESTSGGSEVVLENNKEATINVSSYTAPVEITPTAGKDGMKKATVTLSNIPEIEANKAQTIDVSTYTEPVEITPTAGKDGMAKATVTLSNIPSPSGSVTAYAWSSGSSYEYLPVSVAPVDASEFLEKCSVGSGGSDGSFTLSPFARLFSDYTKVSDTEFTVVDIMHATVTFTRDSSKDFTLWQTA